MATLYEINQQLLSFEIDPDTGELLNAMQWDDLQLAYAEKVENIACYIKNLKSDIADLKAEEKALAERRRVKENRVEYLTKLLLDNMNEQKFETAKCVVSFRKNPPAVNVLDMDKLPAAFLRTKTVTEPDKEAIRAALKNGETVEGAELITKQSVIIK